MATAKPAIGELEQLDERLAGYFSHAIKSARFTRTKMRRLFESLMPHQIQDKMIEFLRLLQFEISIPVAVNYDERGLEDAFATEVGILVKSNLVSWPNFTGGKQDRYVHEIPVCKDTFVSEVENVLTPDYECTDLLTALVYAKHIIRAGELVSPLCSVYTYEDQLCYVRTFDGAKGVGIEVCYGNTKLPFNTSIMAVRKQV